MVNVGWIYADVGTEADAELVGVTDGVEHGGDGSDILDLDLTEEQSGQLVAAYALMTLELMESPILQNIPPEVLQRRSTVAMATRGVRTSTDLDSTARQAQRRARARASRPIRRWPPTG